MKFVARWTFRLLVLVIVVITGLLLLKDLILRELAERMVRTQTGLEAKIGRLELRLFSPTLAIENLRLYHPPQFGGAVMLDMPELYVEYDFGALWSRRLHLRLLRFRLAELTFVEDRTGRSSLDLVHLGLDQMPKRLETEGPQFGGIDALNISVDRVKLLSLRSAGRSESFDVRLQNVVFTDLHNPEELRAALERVLTRIAVSQLSNRLASPR